MILYYAMGGGLGHLVRARAFLHTASIQDEVAVITASPFAADPRVVAGWRVVHVPAGLEADPALYRRWLQGTLEGLSPRAIYLDAFPAGILGELCDFPLPPGVPVFHLARLLRWERYRPRLSGEPPRLDVTYLLEPLDGEHERFLRALSREVVSLELRDLPHSTGNGQAEPLPKLELGGEPLWLVIHSGWAEEALQLVSYAREMAEMERVAPKMALVAPHRQDGLPEGVAHLDLYPAYPIFPTADRIVTACGFNAMRQTEPYRDRHRFLPFPRLLDDQFLRAARRRRELQWPNLPGQ